MQSAREPLHTNQSVWRAFVLDAVTERVGCRRQTIADLEADRNVALNILMGALAALGKGLTVVDARVELEQLKELFSDDETDEG